MLEGLSNYWNWFLYGPGHNDDDAESDKAGSEEATEAEIHMETITVATDEEQDSGL